MAVSRRESIWQLLVSSPTRIGQTPGWRVGCARGTGPGDGEGREESELDLIARERWIAPLTPKLFREVDWSEEQPRVRRCHLHMGAHK